MDGTWCNRRLTVSASLTDPRQDHAAPSIELQTQSRRNGAQTDMDIFRPNL